MKHSSRSVGWWAGRVALSVVLLVCTATAAVYAVSQRRMSRHFDVPSHPLAVHSDSATVALGERVATVRGCTGCHGLGLAGHVEMDNPMLGRLAGPNLTSGGRGAVLTAADWERAVRHGVRRDGSPLLIMPANEFNGLTDDDLSAVIAYARSLPASPNTPPPTYPGPIIRTMFVAGQMHLTEAAFIDHARPHAHSMSAAPTAAYGAYMVQNCTGCHGPTLSGGKIPGGPPGWKPAANLPPSGIGHYSEADFVRLLQTGRRPDGTQVDSIMPWRATRHMTDVELKALYAYLRTVPPKPTGNR